MAVRKLKFTARFLKEEPTLDVYASNVKEFFSSIQQEKFEHVIEVSDVAQYLDGFNSDSFLFDIKITIVCSNVKRDSDVSNFCSSLIKQWCREARENEFLHWLIPDSCNFSLNNYNNQYSNAKASDFSFGTIPSMKKFVKQYVFSQKPNISTIICSFSHLQRHFSIYVSNRHTRDCSIKGEMGHKILIHYDSLSRIIANMDPSKEVAEIFFVMEHPPFLFVSHSEPEAEELGDGKFARIAKAKELEYGSGKFERTISLGCKCNKTLCTSKKIGLCLVLKISVSDKFQTRWLIEQLILRCSTKTDICFSSLDSVRINYSELEVFKKFPLPGSETISFQCEYAWKVVHSRTLSIKHEIFLKNLSSPNYIDNLLLFLKLCARKDLAAVTKALFFIAELVNKGIMFSFRKMLQKKFEYFCSFVESVPLPPGMCYARRVLITPSRIIFLQPYEHFDNRVIRKYGVEYMLRISVQDDNFSKLTFAVQYNSKKENIMQEVVGKILENGLIIGSRKYYVLASSTSQLREHGLWLYARDLDGNTADTIRNWMGDFSKMKSVAKYMARMGQCFSSTEEGVQIQLNRENEIKCEDIKTKDGRYVFSDGIGMISTEVANEVRTAFKQNMEFSVGESSSYEPSAFQIRYRGCKGMVVENPCLEGKTIWIRPSMEKFDCINSHQLEVVKTSAARRLYLNKHLITILEQMGIPKETFLDLQSDMMLNLLDSLLDEKCAVSLLNCYLNTNFPFSSMLTAGFSLTNDPFFRSLILAFFKAAVANLRSSMRVAVHEKYGRNLLGVLDETQSLKYGQVFIQYSESTSTGNSSFKIRKGPVIVTKNPCLHPGDVRKLTAVDVPKLHHIKDCIVFPACGNRPHPDEMAGSDLDGDEYVAIWYKPLVFKGKNFQPMIYPTYEENSQPKEFTVSDMIEFFCHYIQNDCIGSFANAHLVWADRLEKGIFSNKCMQIAERYPYVLDFAKYGTTKYLKKSERPDQYPDFMQKGLHGNSYHSKRALGSLYRASRVLDACSSKINLMAESVSFDSDLNYPGWEKYKDSAMKHKQKYSTMVTEILNKYSLKSESDAFGGFVEIDVSKKWRQESTNAVKIVKCYIENIMFTFRDIFFQELKEEMDQLELDKKERQHLKYQRASAWYMCTYGTKSEKILSFPWILSDILVEIKSKKNTLPNNNNFLGDIDSDIKECISSGILNVSLMSDTSCLCKKVLQSVVSIWLSTSGLNIWSRESRPACQECSDRVLSYYLSSTQEGCCGSPTQSCSPTKLILKFLKFFVKKTKESLGQCIEDCDGFIPRNLQELALQTLAYLAITRNIKYLGLPFETSNCNRNFIPDSVAGNMFEEEGDPIRIPVNTPELKEIIEEHLEDVKAYLKKNSGVKFLVLRPEVDIHDNCCLIVNSVGKSFERWNLEAILLDPDLTNILKKALDV